MNARTIYSRKDIARVVREVSKGSISQEELDSSCNQIERILSRKFSRKKGIENLDVGICELKRFTPHSPMFYRDFVGVHLARMSVLGPCLHYVIQYGIEKLGLRGKGESFGSSCFDFVYFKEILSRHDEPEIFSPLGDIPSHIKYNLSEESRQLLEQVDIAIEECLSQKYQSIQYYNQEETMKELFRDTRLKISLEAQVMSYIDKIDGFMMAFHEVTGGNMNFVVPLQNYISILKDIQSGKNLPLITPFFSILFSDYKDFLSEIHNPFEEEGMNLYGWFEQFWHIFDIQSIISIETKISHLIKNRAPHTIESLPEDDFGLPAYLCWKRGILKEKSTRYKIGKKEMTFAEHLSTKVETR